MRLLLTIFLVATFVALPASAEESRVASHLASRTQLRRLILSGRGAEARAEIATWLASGISIGDRSALLELYAVGTAWNWEAPHLDAHAKELPIDEQSSSIGWSDAFELARADLVRGAIAAAAKRFDALAREAPDQIDACRTAELRSLAHDALRDLLSTNTNASAVVDPTPAPARWYGWQTLAADGVALVMAPIAPSVGAVLYVAGAPAVHVVNGASARAVASLGVRVGLPFAGAGAGLLIGAAANSCRGPFCGVDPTILASLGGVLGAVAAVTADAVYLAKERVTVEPSRSATLSLRPSAAPRSDGGFDLGVGAMW